MSCIWAGSTLAAVSLETLHQTLKVVLAGLDVPCDCLLLHLGIRADHHDVRRRGELINKADEVFIAHNHRLELVVGLDAAELELLDDVRDLLEAMVVLVVGGVVVGDHEEGALLEEDDLVRLDRVAEAVQTELQLPDVRQKNAHDLRPRLVQRLVPDRSPEALRLVLEVVRR